MCVRLPLRQWLWLSVEQYTTKLNWWHSFAIRIKLLSWITFHVSKGDKYQNLWIAYNFTWFVANNAKCQQVALLSQSSLEPLISLNVVSMKLYSFKARVHCYHWLYIFFSTNSVRCSEELHGGLSCHWKASQLPVTTTGFQCYNCTVTKVLSRLNQLIIIGYSRSKTVAQETWNLELYNKHSQVIKILHMTSLLN